MTHHPLQFESDISYNTEVQSQSSLSTALTTHAQHQTFLSIYKANNFLNIPFDIGPNIAI